jgi:hypothetical protein
VIITVIVFIIIFRHEQGEKDAELYARNSNPKNLAERTKSDHKKKGTSK